MAGRFGGRRAHDLLTLPCESGTITAITCQLPEKRIYAAESEMGVQLTLGVCGNATTHSAAPSKGDITAAAVHLCSNVVRPSRVPATADWPSSFKGIKKQQHFEYVREETKTQSEIKCITNPALSTYAKTPKPGLKSSV